MISVIPLLPLHFAPEMQSHTSASPSQQNSSDSHSAADRKAISVPEGATAALEKTLGNRPAAQPDA